ncbi:MAG: alpha-amylase family glycosyl hydrolase, partial [Oscillospiraceae bacterium]
YYSWYSFKKWPTQYESWWDFDTLPNVKENNPEYGNYINGETGIIRKWLQLGASGWRLDVADELPDEFLDNLRAAAKTAYGIRRRYLQGFQLDTVMNYPFREAILGFLTGAHSSLCMEQIEDILENYPPQAIKLLMNHIGTHDTERAITVLAGYPCNGNSREWQSETHLTPEQYETGISKLRLASLLQFTLPGVPCIYYGDEAGLEGYRDPFNRGCYPWGHENSDLLNWYQTLSHLRKRLRVLKDGHLRNVYSHNDILSFQRYVQNDSGDEESILVAVNRSDSNALIPLHLESPKHLLGTSYSEEWKLPPFGFSILKLKKKVPPPASV